MIARIIIVTRVGNRLVLLRSGLVLSHVSVVLVVPHIRLVESLACLVHVSLVLRVIDHSLVLGIGSSCSGSGDSSDMRGIAAFSLDWLSHRVVKVDDQVLVDGVLVGRLAVIRLLDSIVHASSLGSAVVDSVRVLEASAVHVDRHVVVVLNRRVVQRIVPSAVVRDRRSNILAHNLPALLHLLGVERSSHVEVLLVASGDRIRRVVGGVPWLVHHSLVGWIVLQSSAETHLLLKVDLGLLVGLLSIPQLLVSPVDEVVAGRDVVVAVVFNALLSILAVEVELVDDLVEQLVLNRHLLLAREQALVPVPVLDLERPGVVSDVVHVVPLLWIGVEYPANHVLALRAEELGQGVVGTHDLLVQIARLRILKGQVAANHGIEDDARRPNVGSEAVVPLASDHFGRSIARRATSRLESGGLLIHVR